MGPGATASPTAPPLALLLLADGRLPAGGHAHSGGVEQAVDDGLVRDLEDLADLLAGRLETVGRLEAHAASLACALGLAALAAGDAPPGRLQTALAALDAELDARIPSAAARRASRAQGAAHLALAGEVLAGAAALGEASVATPHLAVALGLAAAAAGLDAPAAAALALYQGLAGPASAALRLLGLHPVAVSALVARLAGRAEAIAVEAAGAAELPLVASPVLEVLQERHDEREGRLFAS